MACDRRYRIRCWIRRWYTVSQVEREGKTAELEQEIVRLEKEVRDQRAFEFTSDKEASAAIATSGRPIQIPECQRRQAVPGVTCTGVITTTNGTFVGGGRHNPALRRL